MSEGMDTTFVIYKSTFTVVSVNVKHSWKSNPLVGMKTTVLTLQVKKMYSTNKHSSQSISQTKSPSVRPSDRQLISQPVRQTIRQTDH